jgi:hypothetical protein
MPEIAAVKAQRRLFGSNEQDRAAYPPATVADGDEDQVGAELVPAETSACVAEPGKWPSQVIWFADATSAIL